MEKFVPALPASGKARSVYCGPYALAVVNQISCDEANEGVKRSLRRKRRVQGMWPGEMERVSRGKYFKHPLKLVPVKDKPTLRTLPDHLKPNRLYVVIVSHHYVVIDTGDWTLCDTFSRAWIPIEASVWRLARVRCVAEAPRP